MANEYRFTFPDDASGDVAERWDAFRPRLAERLAALAECAMHGHVMELRTPANRAPLPDLVVALRENGIYVCRHGNSALTQRVLGTILLGLADEGLATQFAAST